MKKCIVVLCVFMLSGTCIAWCQGNPILFDFENDIEYWRIPDWADEQFDVVSKNVSKSSDISSTGKSSLKLGCEFPGNSWSAAIVEYENHLNVSLEKYENISVDIYIPVNAPAELLAAKIILTIDSSWQWIEMRKSVPLQAGKWITVRAPLATTPSGELKHWICAKDEKCLIDQLGEVKKIAVRIEYNENSGKSAPAYKGDIYIDNVILE